MGRHKEKSKKHKKEKKHKKKERKLSSSSSSAEEWVEKVKESIEKTQNKGNQERDQWMSMSSNFHTISNIDRRKEREENKRSEKEKDQYNPRENVRELNPYWKDGGEGLPSFKKPTDEHNFEYKKSYSSASTSSWRKKAEDQNKSREAQKDGVTTDIKNSESSRKELNTLAAKLIKAELMNNTDLIAELKNKIDVLQKSIENTSTVQEVDVLLTTTDNRGQSRPLVATSRYDEASAPKRKKQNVDTHKDGQRIKYFADDDKYSLKQMFENEKYQSIDDQNKEFVKIASKVKTDFDDIFVDEIRKKESDEKADKRNVDKAISKQQLIMKSLDNCKLCLQSDVMDKHLLVSMGEIVYLSIPPYEPLTEGHCFIIPVRHVPCATQLDENEWSEVLDFRRSLCEMYKNNNEDVIFFETASYLHKYPHMKVECVPIPKEQGDLAPIYFKKAIDESEIEWTSNKKLVSLANRDVRRAIPKGLPYFSVSFGMTEGFAHVIEDEKIFPQNFAQEIIGGMLDLHHSKWRKPKRQNFEEQSLRVQKFSKIWSDFDCTQNK